MAGFGGVIAEELGTRLGSRGALGLPPDELSKYHIVHKLHVAQGAEIALWTQTPIQAAPSRARSIERVISEALFETGYTIMIASSARRGGELHTAFVAKHYREVDGQFAALHHILRNALYSSSGAHLCHGWLERLAIDPEDYKRVIPIV